MFLIDRVGLRLDFEDPCPVLRVGIETVHVLQRLDIVARVPAGLQDGVIECQDPAVSVDHTDADGRILEQDAILLLVL